MATKLNKKVGQLKQWTAERSGKATKSEVDDDFKALDAATEEKLEAIQKLANDTRSLLHVAQPVQTPSGSLLSRAKKAEGGPRAKNSFDQLGQSMVEIASDLPEDSSLGAAMAKCGESLSKVGSALIDWDAEIRELYLQPMTATLDEDIKEYEHLKKKLENRRLDYDAKRTNLQKSKKEDKSELENEVNNAKNKYEETISTLRDLMLKVSANEAAEIAMLEQFVSANRKLFELGAKVFAELEATLTDPNVRSTRAVARPLSAELSTDASDRALGGSTTSTAPPPSIVSSGSVPKLGTPTAAAGAAAAQAPPPVSAKKPLPGAVAMPGGPAPAFPKPGSSGAPTAGAGGSSSGPAANGRAAPAAATAPKPSALSTGAGGGAGAAASSSGSVPPPRPKPRASPPVTGPERVRALYAFTADNPDELTFAKGDIITIVTKVDESWYVGELNGQKGLFPNNYVEPL